MTELYSIKTVATLLSLHESRLRYWMQTGFVAPSVRKDGRFFYTFGDLIAVKAARELLDAGLSTQKVRKNLDALREALPDQPQPLSRLRICSDGDTLVAVDHDAIFEPASGQMVMAFEVASLSTQLADILALPRTSAAAPTAVPAMIDDGPTESHPHPSAYRCFLEGRRAEEDGDDRMAEDGYRRALELEPSLAAAHTNLGNIAYRQGELGTARAAYETALEHEPTQAEARFNLGNLLDDVGETELAIAELRRVCWTHPEFADAHYNLGLLLARVGGVAQAQQHLERYLELDHGSEWSSQAREFLGSL